MQENINIRFMKESDLDSVIAIEESSYPHPWTRSIFRDCLYFGYHCFALVASECLIGSERLIGYAITSIAAGECHILNFVVAKSKQRQGLGLHLLCYVIAHAKKNTVERMILEVRLTNTAAINLYERQGFKRIGIRKAYYDVEDGKEDAIVMKLDM